MTIEELSGVLLVKESYIKTHWPRIVNTYKKKDIELYKIGRGDNANYGVKMPWDDDVCWDSDALEMIR